MERNYRRCLVCRTVADKSEFLRVVRSHPSHEVLLDTGMGRSAYLCPQVNCLRAAQKKSRLGRSLKAPIPDSIFKSLWERLTQGDS